MDATREFEDDQEVSSGQDDQLGYNEMSEEVDFKKSVVDLERYLVRSMVKKCKLHACIFPYIKAIEDLRGRYNISWSGKELLDFSDFTGDPRKLERAVGDLKRNIMHLLPGFLEDESDILSNKNLQDAVREAKSCVQRECTKQTSKELPFLPKTPGNTFQELLLNELVESEARKLPQTADGDQSSTQPQKLSSIALNKVFQELGQRIAGAEATASFTCGGSISIHDQEARAPDLNENPNYTQSSPVQIWWASRDGKAKERLILPLNQSRITCPDSTVSRLQQLVADCDPASFGRGKEDVIDPEYRKAGKLDPQRFSSSFHPANFGIIDSVERVLLPRFNSQTENLLPFRKLTAQLYKLNIYSGPSGLFQKHVDTPRSKNQIGSLVVCLPSPFEGGNLLVRHHGREVDFNWSHQSASEIQWAAFYSDCEHEIRKITDGQRITLTYNLFVTEPMAESIPEKSIISPRSLPIYSDFREILSEPGFMKDGGVLGIPCSHAYPHTSGYAKALFPSGLKAADLTVYSALLALGVEVKVLPVLEQRAANDEYLEEDKVESFLRYLKEGKRFKVDYWQIPAQIPLDLDVDRYWKKLYTARHVIGFDGFVDFARDSRKKDLQITSNEFWMNRGAFVGADLNPYTTTNYSGEDIPMSKTIDECWKSLYHPSITWITEPRHKEMAFSYLAYGNESSIETMYSHAAIIAIVPPFRERERRIKLNEETE